MAKTVSARLPEDLGKETTSIEAGLVSRITGIVRAEFGQGSTSQRTSTLRSRHPSKAKQRRLRMPKKRRENLPVSNLLPLERSKVKKRSRAHKVGAESVLFPKIL